MAPQFCTQVARVEAENGFYPPWATKSLHFFVASRATRMSVVVQIWLKIGAGILASLQDKIECQGYQQLETSIGIDAIEVNLRMY